MGLLLSIIVSVLWKVDFKMNSIGGKHTFNDLTLHTSVYTHIHILLLLLLYFWLASANSTENKPAVISGSLSFPFCDLGPSVAGLGLTGQAHLNEETDLDTSSHTAAVPD